MSLLVINMSPASARHGIRVVRLSGKAGPLQDLIQKLELQR